LENITLIVDKFINELNGQLAEKRVLVKLDDSAKEWLAKNGFDGEIRRASDGAADSR
jgi:ATP-dependent Clp protease ATP-binding subunit ClpA